MYPLYCSSLQVLWLTASQWGYVFSAVYAPAVFFIKFTILSQYLRLLAPNITVNRALFIGARAMIMVIFMYYVAATIGGIIQCSPREKAWNPLITEGRCLSKTLPIFVSVSFNMVSDVITLLLPAKTVWELQIPRRKKIKIVALFAIGLL